MRTRRLLLAPVRGAYTVETQSGERVTVTNAAYNGTLNPGASTTTGFTGTFTGNDTAPSSVACTVG